MSSDLNLQNFTSIFEIFFGYHMLVAFSDRLRNLLNVNAHVSSLINNHVECNRYKAYIEKKAGKKRLFGFAFLSKIFIRSIDRSKCRFLEDKLFALLKSSYVYFGLLSVTYLLFAGLLNVVIYDSHLMLINLISSIVAIFYLLSSFRSSKHNVTWGGVRVFFSTILIFCIVLLVPQKVIANNSFIPMISINIFDWFKIQGYENMLVVWSILLILTPILIEILHIFLCVVQLKFLKYSSYISFIVNEFYFSFTTLRKLRKDTSKFDDIDNFIPDQN